MTAKNFVNSLFIVACNRCGENSAGLSFSGTGIIIDLSGKVIEKNTSGKESMIVTDIKAKLIDRARNHKMRYFLPNRRPEVYY